ncbi:MAG: 30S ribosomal protein S1 [Phycisphaerales bacterium]|nr:30S ribosomal protein S1 [Phycisphaerales bacterium]
MVDETLLRELSVSDDETEAMIKEALGEVAAAGDMDALLSGQIEEFAPGNILKGIIVGFAGDDVVVDVGLKSEGLVDRNEFEDEDPIVGHKVEVLLENVEGEGGIVEISKRKADRIRGWERILESHNEDDIVQGKIIRKIKGGLLMDIGVPVFLPASQVDIRRPGNIDSYLGREIRAKILKIDQERRNIVVSRRKLIEDERSEQKERLLSTLKEGDTVPGTVKNLADFGAFVDLGGIDGLLHITDMSWTRISHPADLLKIDQQVDVKVLHIDYEKEKIALGLKQLEASPWEDIEDRFPVGYRVKGTVVNIVSYGAFIRLDEGIEGLVHISEMSWTRRINHPSELINVDDELEVVVLDIDKNKQEISLGMKQVEVNPWELVAEKYPKGTIIEGKIRNLANYGAFVEIEPGIDGLLHVSDLSWTRKVAHPNEMLKKGDTVKCVVLDVDQTKQRIALGVKQLEEDPWLSAIPGAYQPGMVVHGKVTKITNFGVFVELEDDLEGLLHISELADHKVENPQDIVKAGEEVEVKILRVDTSERKIGLSLKRAQWGAGEQEREGQDPDRPRKSMPTRGGMDEHGALGSDKIEFS